MMRFVSRSEAGMHTIAKRLVPHLLRKKGEGALVIALEGELGSGKTTFTKGFAAALGVDRRVVSPTFLLMRCYRIPKKLSGMPYRALWHIDCFRICNADDIRELDWEELVRDPKNILVIEWADRIKKIIPRHAVWLTFYNKGDSIRKITFRSPRV